METRGWEEAKAFIRKHTAEASLEADLEHKVGGSGHVVKSISGAGNKSPSQSPGQRRSHNNEQRERETEPHKEEDQEEETDETYSREEAEKAVTQEFSLIDIKSPPNLPILAQNQKKEDGQIEGRITPYPRSPESSRDQRGAS